jgi:hypothetical protein
MCDGKTSRIIKVFTGWPQEASLGPMDLGTLGTSVLIPSTDSENTGVGKVLGGR